MRALGHIAPVKGGVVPLLTFDYSLEKYACVYFDAKAEFVRRYQHHVREYLNNWELGVVVAVGLAQENTFNSFKARDEIVHRAVKATFTSFIDYLEAVS